MRKFPLNSSSGTLVLSLALIFARGIPTFAAAEEPIAELPELRVTASRSASTHFQNPFSTRAIDRQTLESLPQRRLDDALRILPGFGLFRRSSSRVAHPTIQGVSLRNLGPNGAGRTLVLHDGIPLNDPFGGWVYWNRLFISGLDRIETQRGGGSGPWGNSALAGVIHLFSRATDGDSTLLEASGGNRGTYETSVLAQRVWGNGAVSIAANRISSEGYPILRADQRGPVDRNAFSQATSLQGAVTWDWSETTSLSLRASYLDEDRGNGTPLNTNQTEAFDTSLTLLRHLEGGPSWRTQIYYQKRDFRNQFTSVNAERTSENPALEQFDVPAQAWGGSAVITLDSDGAHRLVGGVDARLVEGETNERFFFSDDSFRRQRGAGGSQILVGFFMEDVWDLGNSLHLTIGSRLDYWKIGVGRRRQLDLNSGEIRRDDTFAERDEWIGNYRFGFTYQPGDTTRFRGAFYTGFRAPTLNELYRPFRVRVDITEANPDLARERLYGGEFGLDWRPTEAGNLSVTLFLNALDNAIANVTLASGPGFVQPCGFVPNGGTCRQRRNLGQAQVAGLEVEGSWRLDQQLQLSTSYLHSRTEITDSPDLTLLEGNRMAQAPEHQFSLSLHWNPIDRLKNTLQIRFMGDQFEDDLNSRKLDPFVVVDLSTFYTINEDLEAFLSLENLFDTEFQTGIASNGLVSIGAPRLITGGLRWRR